MKMTDKLEISGQGRGKVIENHGKIHTPAKTQWPLETKKEEGEAVSEEKKHLTPLCTRMKKKTTIMRI